MKKNDIHRIVDGAISSFMNESSINRIKSWIDSHDIAILTAYRNVFTNATNNTLDDRPNDLKQDDEKNGITNPLDKSPYTYTRSEKENRNKNLKATLLRMGYGVTRISGNYIENYKNANEHEVSESSFLVVNLNGDTNFYNNIFKLSEYYNQDSFLYKSKNDDVAYLIGTNNAEFPGYNQKISTGKFHMNIDSEFLSRYGNKSFSFTNTQNPDVDNRTYNFNTRKQARIDSSENTYPISLNEWKMLERNSKWTISLIADPIISSINQLQYNNLVKEDDEPVIKKQRGGRRANTTAFMQKNRGISANKSLRGNVAADGSRKVSLNVGAPEGGVTLKTFNKYYKTSSNKIQKTDSIKGTPVIKIIDYWDANKTIKKLVALFTKATASVSSSRVYILRTVVEFNEKGVRTTTYKHNDHGYLIEKITYADDGTTVIKSENIPLPKDSFTESKVSHAIDMTWIKNEALDYFNTSIYKPSNKNNINCIRNINEVDINRLLKHVNDAGVIIISACRQSDDDGNPITSSENKRTSSELENDIRQSGFTYMPVYSGYTYKNADNESIPVFEISFIVYNYTKNENGYVIGDFNKLQKYALDLCKKYKQETVYIQPAGQSPAYYDQNGNKVTHLASVNRVDNLDTQKFMYDLKWESMHNCQLFLNSDVNSLRENMIRRHQNNEFIL